MDPVSERIRVAVVFGGRSAEHEVSLQSARYVVESLDRTKYDPVLIGIDRTGRWFLNDGSLMLLDEDDTRSIRMKNGSTEVALTANGARRAIVPVGHATPNAGAQAGRALSEIGPIDVIFPVLHGPYGEDGTIQGLAKLADLPCVGAGVLGSAVGMDKDVMKRLLRDAEIPIARFVAFTERDCNRFTFESVAELFGTPVYVKPANLGSSVGVARAGTAAEYDSALREAFEYDTKIIVEECVSGREIEVAVLGNDDPRASVPGEIVPMDGFYSYDAKYIDAEGAALKIPAELPADTVARLQEAAIHTFRVVECSGMARVDFFLRSDGGIVVNEINTIPGFTRISMYPKLWHASGVPGGELVDTLITLAREKYTRESALKTEPR
ncbi:MAG: D-alanine--D-alanine ligase [Spirochaetaceae bacterium]|nr:MAG: D-alanine--D-alanine ligase [Spirochaetaceae bacterium]